MKITMPSEVNFIIDELHKQGKEAYAVGGCIRDSILNRQPNDWDITTNCLPEDIIKYFEKTIPTGLKHGTITVMINSNPYEVTTFRIDGEYKDNRHPDNVAFVTDVREDLKRRDFTINAMAYSNEKGLLDYFNGIHDLNNKIIRTVGDSKERFNEDALRMMRAVRFAAQLGFSIDDNIVNAIKELNSNIKNVSIERIRTEFDKILVSNSNYVVNLMDLGLLQYFMKEVCDLNNCSQNHPRHIYNVFNHTMHALNNVPNKLTLKLAMLLHDTGKVSCKTTDENGVDHFYKHALVSTDIAEKILKRMKYDNKTINDILILIKYHDAEIHTSKAIRRMLTRIGPKLFEDLLYIKKGDLLGQNPVYHKEGLEILNDIKEKYHKIMKNKECFSIKNLNVDGKDLIDIGIEKGKNIGLVLKFLLEKVIEDPLINNKEELLKLSKSYYINILNKEKN